MGVVKSLRLGLGDLQSAVDGPTEVLVSLDDLQLSSGIRQSTDGTAQVNCVFTFPLRKFTIILMADNIRVASRDVDVTNASMSRPILLSHISFLGHSREILQIVSRFEFSLDVVEYPRCEALAVSRVPFLSGLRRRLIFEEKFDLEEASAEVEQTKQFQGIRMRVLKMKSSIEEKPKLLIFEDFGFSLEKWTTHDYTFPAGKLRNARIAIDFGNKKILSGRLPVGTMLLHGTRHAEQTVELLDGSDVASVVLSCSFTNDKIYGPHEDRESLQNLSNCLKFDVADFEAVDPVVTYVGVMK